MSRCGPTVVASLAKSIVMLAPNGRHYRAQAEESVVQRRKASSRDDRHRVALKEILNALCLTIEEYRPGTLASVLLLHPDGLHLDSVAGPSLPKDGPSRWRNCPLDHVRALAGRRHIADLGS